MAGALGEVQGPGGLLSQFLKDLGPCLMKKYKPKAIVAFSAHWETPGGGVVTDYGDENPLLYDCAFPHSFFPANPLMISANEQSTASLTSFTKPNSSLRVTMNSPNKSSRSFRRPRSSRAALRASLSREEKTEGASLDLASVSRSFCWMSSVERTDRSPFARRRSRRLRPLQANVQWLVAGSHHSSLFTLAFPVFPHSLIQRQTRRSRSPPPLPPPPNALSGPPSNPSDPKASSSSRVDSRFTTCATSPRSTRRRPSPCTASGRRQFWMRCRSLRCAALSRLRHVSPILTIHFACTNCAPLSTLLQSFSLSHLALVASSARQTRRLPRRPRPPPCLPLCPSSCRALRPHLRRCWCRTRG